MKLILCLACHDVYKLTREGKRYCACGNTWGEYLDDGLKAEVSENPDTQVLGFLNNTLAAAVYKQRNEGDRTDGMGHAFIAFLMPDDAPNVKKIKE